jgi:hypothetical protein
MSTEGFNFELSRFRGEKEGLGVVGSWIAKEICPEGEEETGWRTETEAGGSSSMGGCIWVIGILTTGSEGDCEGEDLFWR